MQIHSSDLARRKPQQTSHQTAGWKRSATCSAMKPVPCVSQPRAISLDAALDGSRVNLAEFYRKSEQTYAEAISISPERADLRYGHALSLIRKKALSDAIAELEEAVRLDGRSSRYKTTLAVALDSVGRTQEALGKLDTGAAARSDADITGLALQYSLKLQRLPDALKFAERIAHLRPQNQQVSDLLRQLRQAVNQK